MEARPAFTASVDAQLVSKRFMAMNVGDVLTYEQLEEIVGADVRGQKRYIVHTAMRIAFREKSIVIQCVPKVGYKRASDAEIIDAGDATSRRVLKSTGRALRGMATVNYDELSSEDKQRHNVTSSQLGAIQLMSRQTSRKRLEEAVNQSQEQIPFAKVAKLFGNGSS